MEIEISPIQLPASRVIVSRGLSMLVAITAVGLVVVYAMNVWCVASDAKRPLLVGNMRYEATRDSRGGLSEISGKMGIDRAFMEAVPNDNTAYVTLGGTRIAVENMSIGGWMAYVIFLTLCLAVALLFLISLTRLFYGFSRGRIFTRDSIRNIQMTGIAVLLGGGLQFSSLFFAILINSCSLNPAGAPGQVHGSAVQFPVVAIVCAVMIILTALMFEEGRKLSEEASLTI